MDFNVLEVPWALQKLWNQLIKREKWEVLLYKSGKSPKKLEKIRKNEEKRPKIRNKKSKFNKRAGSN